ncbi:reverse transcriptase domain-containing protein [Tanacetum coccineum]
MNGNWNKRYVDNNTSSNNEWKESKNENPSNTAIDSFFKAYDVRNIEKENEQGQTKRKDNNNDDKQPNKKRCKAEKFEAIQYSLGPNEEYIAIRSYEYDIWERNKNNLSIIYQDIFQKKDEGWKCMSTRSSSHLIAESSTTPKRRKRRRSKQRVEPFSLEETHVVPPIPVEHFELKHSLINLVTSKQFFGFEKEDPHAHIRYFNKITSTLKYKDVPETSIKLILFPFSIDSPTRIWLDKEPSRSILTWDDLVSKFINHFFPPSKTTNLRNEISNFQQKFKETFSEAWDRFKDLLCACPHHGFTELHQLDTFYNDLNLFDQDSLNFAAGGNLLERSAQDVLKIIENKSKVCNSRNKPIVSQVKASNVDSSEIASAVASAVTSAMTAMFKQHQIVECLALADLGASINLMPLSIWKKLSLPELTPTRMILELADRSTTSPSGIAKDVFVKVGKFHFSADFIVVDYVVDPRVPLILGRSFLRTAHALIDVYGEELTLRVDDEAITFKVGQTSRYSYNDAESVNRIDVIDVSCEEYAQEVLGFLDSSTSGNPTPSLDPILSTSFPPLTPFAGGDFILEEIKACLTNDSIPPGIDDADFDLEGDLLLLEKLLNDDPSSPLPPKELHFEEIKTIKSSIDDPPELELKDLPSHLEYAFLEGTDKLPVIISKELKDEEKAALLKVLKSHKWAIAWKISDIKGIDPSFCTHKILMEDDFKPAIQHQRRVNPKIHEVIKKEVIKLLDAGLIYPISDSPWALKTQVCYVGHNNHNGIVGLYRKKGLDILAGGLLLPPERRTDNQEKNEKQSQNNKTGLGMEKTVKDKAKSKPESQSSQKVNRKVNWSKSKSTQVNPGAKDYPDYEDSHARGFIHRPLDLKSFVLIYGNPIS